MSSSHDITLTPQEQALIMRLKSFRVPEMAHILEEQLKDPNADLNTFMERMTAMVDAEWQARADKRFNRLMKEVLWSSFFVTLVAKKIVLINLCCRPCFIWGSITVVVKLFCNTCG